MLNFWLAAQRGRDELPLASVQVASLLEGARYCTRSLYPFRSLRPPLDIPRTTPTQRRRERVRIERL